jgi:hypothetical protein
MNDVSDVDTRKGDIVIGATLVLAGLAVVLDRTGAFQWRDQWTLWPIILGVIGLARFVQSVPGQPKQGLLFLTAAAWLCLSEGGWISPEDSWPIAIIALGLIVALNGGRRRRWRPEPPPSGTTDTAHVRRRHRRHDATLSPLAVLGVWIGIFVALQVSGISGIRSFNEALSTGERVRVVAVMGRSEHISRATAFQGADITNVMGKSDIDLREATLAPGANATMHVFSAMGTVELRVPPTWIVDTGAISAFGGVRDERVTPAKSVVPQAEAGAPAEAGATPAEAEAGANQAPRLVLRGLVMFGRLHITS